MFATFPMKTANGTHINVLQQFYYFPHHVAIPPNVPPTTTSIPQTPPTPSGPQTNHYSTSEPRTSLVSSEHETKTGLTTCTTPTNTEV